MRAVVAFVLLAGAVVAEEVQFSVFQVPEFNVFRVAKTGPAPEFTVFDVKPEKWRVRVYTATWCGPCKLLHNDWDKLPEDKREELPFTLEFEYQVPKSVKHLPTFAFTSRDGQVQKIEGYRSIDAFRKEFEKRKLGNEQLVSGK